MIVEAECWGSPKTQEYPLNLEQTTETLSRLPSFGGQFLYLVWQRTPHAARAGVWTLPFFESLSCPGPPRHALQRTSTLPELKPLFSET